MKKYLKSMYVETFAITLIVLSAFAIIATTIGFFYINPEGFVEKGTAVPSSVYATIYTVLGLVIFYHILLILASVCFLILNKEKKR